MAIVLGFLLTIGLASLVIAVVGYFSEDRRELRSEKKNNNYQLIVRTKQLNTAKRALIKVAAGDSGNPSLDASIALEEIQGFELTELENR